MRGILLLTAGFISLATGVVGIILPILPTTPFVLLAAICFSGSSPRLYRWLCGSRYFGEFIQNYKDKSGISRTVKVRSIVFLWVTLILSAYFSKSLTLAIILLIIGTAVTVHIISLKGRF